MVSRKGGFQYLKIDFWRIAARCDKMMISVTTTAHVSGHVPLSTGKRMRMTNAAQRAPGCILVLHGEPQACIVLNPETRSDAETAIQELLRGVARVTGARLYLDGGDRSLEMRRDAPATLHFRRAGTGNTLGKDGFRTRVTPDEIVFEANHKAGFRNAVYTFLERYGGFRWLWPGDAGETHATSETLVAPLGTATEVPDFRWRHLLQVDMPDNPQGKWAMMELHMRCAEATQAVMTQWLMRNRMGGLKVLASHTWGRFVSPDVYGASHPEWFAQIRGTRQGSPQNFNGKHGGQLCTSNPGLIKHFIEQVRAHFDRHPDLDVISISPNDGGGFCECDACIATDVKFGNPPPIPDQAESAALEATFQDDADRTQRSSRITGPLTDRIFDFANKIAAGIADSHPDKYLLMLVYGPYKEPPRQVKLADSVIAQYCVRCHQHGDPAIRDADFENVRQLSAATTEAGIYEYFDQGAWPGLPRLFPDWIAQSVRHFKQHGVRYYSTQGSTGFAVNGFNFWYLSKVLWDSQTSVEEALHDYCAAAFGDAAEPMQGYYNLWRERWRTCRGIVDMSTLAPFEQILKLYPPEFMDAARKCIDQARSCTRPETAPRNRVAWIARGLEGVEIAVEAARCAYALRDQGWPITRNADITPAAVAALGPPEQVRDTARQALRLWMRWEAFLESNRNDFLISFFWARYCFDARCGWHPYSVLRRILELVR